MSEQLYRRVTENPDPWVDGSEKCLGGQHLYVPVEPAATYRVVNNDLTGGRTIMVAESVEDAMALPVGRYALVGLGDSDE